MLRHTFVTTMLDAGVDLGDVQIAARHADSRTTVRYDRARQNLDRHPKTSWPPAEESTSQEVTFGPVMTRSNGERSAANAGLACRRKVIARV
jgi:hypothetical protein